MSAERHHVLLFRFNKSGPDIFSCSTDSGDKTEYNVIYTDMNKVQIIGWKVLTLPGKQGSKF